MNKERRKMIEEAIGALSGFGEAIERAKELVTEAAEGEREYYDNMHENLQNSARGEKASEAADALEEVQSTLDDLVVEDLVAKLEESMEQA